MTFRPNDPILEISIREGSTVDTFSVVAAYTRPGSLPVKHVGVMTLDRDTRTKLLMNFSCADQYGVVLGEALFQGPIRDAFLKAYAGHERLRLWLNIEAVCLRDLNWERLCAPTGPNGGWRLIAPDQRIPFHLHLNAEDGRGLSEISRRDLRALIVSADTREDNDYGLSPFSGAPMIADLRRAMEPEIPCDVLEPEPGVAMLDTLSEKLTSGDYTLLHIIAHGRHLHGKIQLYLHDEQGEPTALDAAEIITRLSRVQGEGGLPRLVFLCACETAAPNAEGPKAHGGLPQRLVRELGIPAAVGMSQEVGIDSASVIAPKFYAFLKKHGQPDRALSEACAGAVDQQDLTVPVLFSRLEARPLFNDDRNLALADAEIERGLLRCEKLIVEQAPDLNARFKRTALVLRAHLGDARERSRLKPGQTIESALDDMNQICEAAFDRSFRAIARGDKIPTTTSRKKARLVIPLAVAAFVVVQIAVFLFYWSKHQSRLAREAEAFNLSEQAAAANDQGHYAEAAELALQALTEKRKRGDTTSHEARAQLYRAMTNLPNRILLNGHRKPVTRVAFSPGGDMLLTVAGSEARLWSARDGKPAFVLSKHESPISTAVFSNDGKRILTAARQAIVWDSSTGEPLGEFPHPRAVRDAAFHGSGDLIATACGDGNTRLWRLNEPAPYAILGAHQEPVTRVAFSRDGELIASGADDGVVNVYRVVDGSQIAKLDENAGKITALHFTVNGKGLVYATHRRNLIHHDLARLAEPGVTITLDSHIQALSSNKGGQIIAACQDGATSTWTPGETPAVTAAQNQELLQSHFSGNLKLLSANDQQGRVYLRDARTAVTLNVQTLEGATCTALSPDANAMATGHQDGQVQLWSTEETAGRFVFGDAARDVRIYALHPQGTHLFSARGGTAKLWKLKTGKNIGAFDISPAMITNVGFSPVGDRIYHAADNGTLSISNTEDGRLLNRFFLPATMVQAKLSKRPLAEQVKQPRPAGIDQVYFPRSSTAIVLFTESGKAYRLGPGDIEIEEIQTPLPLTGPLALAPEGNRLAYMEAGHLKTAAFPQAGDALDLGEIEAQRIQFNDNGSILVVLDNAGVIRVIRNDNGQVTARVDMPPDSIGSMAIHPVGQYLFTGGVDGRAHLWDLTVGKAVAVMDRHLGPIGSAVFSGDGGLLTASDDGTTRTWPFPEKRRRQVAQAEERLGHYRDLQHGGSQ